MRFAKFVGAIGVFAASVSSAALAGEAKVADKPIDNFTLKSHFGKEYSLQDFSNKDAVVVVFVGTECPLAKLYGPRLGELAKKYGDRVAFLGIDSNQQDSLQEITAYATRHKIEFPILKDTGNKIADKFAAARTPEVFVLDKGRTVRYRGRIDDQYGFADGVGYQRPEATRNDLAEAIDDVLAGKSVGVPTTDVVGCRIGRVREAKKDSEVTYAKQVSRIFQEHCIECHRPGRIGPFVMTSYEDVVGWGEMIGEVVDQGRMPPWHASPEYGHFQNDLRLSEEEKETIRTWVENGCPEGDPADLPPIKEFVEGWAIGEPEQIVYMSDEAVEVPAEGVVNYYHFVVDPGWKEDKWIKAAEAKPGVPECVHHILVFVQPPGGGGGFGREGFRRGPGGDGRDGFRRPAGDGPPRDGDGARPPRGGFGGDRGRFGRGGGPPGGGLTGGNLIAGYAPGMNPLFNNEGHTAVHVKAGSKLIFQLHYTPNGTPHKDRSYLGFVFADPKEVKYEARSSAVVNFFFVIPPGAENHAASADTVFDHDTTLMSLTPHMHTRGKSFRYEVAYPNGEKEILLDVPAYDFNWQTSYHLKEPKPIPKGTTLTCTAHWDNSENNLSNPDPTKKVTWGDQTWEEMMIGFYVEVFPKGKAPERTSPVQSLTRLDPAKIFGQLDSNQDGKLTKDELPDRIGDRLAIADTDGDGAVSKEELTRLMKLVSGFQRGGDRGGDRGDGRRDDRRENGRDDRQ